MLLREYFQDTQTDLKSENEINIIITIGPLSIDLAPQLLS